MIVSLSDLLQDEIAAYEACTAGDNYFFQFYLNISLVIALMPWQENSSK